MRGKTYYYSDELRDDFAGTNIKKKPLPENYRYIPGRVRAVFAGFLHHFIATPLCFLYLKIGYGEKIVGREKLKPYKKSGYFLFGNHTRAAGDAFTPTMVSFPKKPYIIVNSDAVSIRGVKRLVEDLGGMPVPDSLQAHKKFLSAIETRAKRGDVVAIYPEAHIWPLYTGVRNFSSTSFSYPVSQNKPVFAFTTTYQRGIFGRVKSKVFIDGPFFADETLSKKAQKEDLRDKVYLAMLSRTSANSVYSPNEFILQEMEEGVECH